MLTASSRLLRLLSLLQTRRHWAGAELAERLEIHPRTLRRDIDRLRELGYPVHASSGVAGGCMGTPPRSIILIVATIRRESVIRFPEIRSTLSLNPVTD